MRISLVTAAFNSGATLRDTLESVLRQDYPDIEHIVVDAGSSDNTVEILREYEPRYNGRLKWISEPDLGRYDGMNKGIKMATGDIVGIINSDDFYHHDDIISKVAREFEADPALEGVYGDVRYVRNSNLKKTVRYYSSKKFRPSKFRYGFMPAHPSFFTYRRFFDKYGYYKTDYQISGDFELLMRFILTNGMKPKYMAEDFLKMRMGGASTASWRSTLLINREIVRACRENGVSTSMPRLFLKYFVKIFEFVNTHN